MSSRVKVMVAVAVLGLGVIGVTRYFLYDIFRRTVALPSYATITLPDAGYTVRAEVARTPEERVRGLSGRDALTAGTGMLFVFDMLDQHHLWMRGMRFSIDIIWIAGGVVVDTHENLPVPPPDADPATLPYFNPRPQALFALEVPAGDVAAHHIVPGQRVELRLIDAHATMEYDMNAREWAMLNHTDQVPPDAWYCATDSTWRGRPDKLVPYLQAEGVSDPHLFHAATIISEVGDNCFAHNATAWPDVPGCWFEWSHDSRSKEVHCIVADRGRGMLQSLQRVRADLQHDRDALRVALTEQVTGRAPENRGRGLKLVIRTLDSIPRRSFVLQSGSAAFACASPRQAADVVGQINDSADHVRGTYGEFSLWYEG